MVGYLLVHVPVCLLSYVSAESSFYGHNGSVCLQTGLGQSCSVPLWSEPAEASSYGEEEEGAKETRNGYCGWKLLKLEEEEEGNGDSQSCWKLLEEEEGGNGDSQSCWTLPEEEEEVESGDRLSELIQVVEENEGVGVTPFG